MEYIADLEEKVEQQKEELKKANTKTKIVYRGRR